MMQQAGRWIHHLLQGERATERGVHMVLLPPSAADIAAVAAFLSSEAKAGR